MSPSQPSTSKQGSSNTPGRSKGGSNQDQDRKPQQASSSNAMQEWDDLGGVDADDGLDMDDFKSFARDHVLFCIDGSASMQTPLPDAPSFSSSFDQANPSQKPSQAHLDTAGRGKSPLHMALEVVLAVEKAKVLTGPNDSVGVLIYNVDSSRAPAIHLASGTRLENFRTGTILFQSMRQINAEEIKRIKNFIEDANEQLATQPSSSEHRSQPQSISVQFPPLPENEPVDMADVFECCNHAFRDLGTGPGHKLTGTKRVFLVTDNDKPERITPHHSKIKNLRDDPRGPARIRFIDLNSFGVQVDPFFISRPGKAFDQDEYWNDVLYIKTEPDDDDDDEAVGEKARDRVALAQQDGMVKLEELMETQVYRTGMKRTLFRAPLKFGGKEGEITIGIQGYAMVAPVQKPTYKYYDFSRREAEEAKTKTIFTSAMTGAALDPSEIGYAYSFGKSDVGTNLADNYWARLNSRDSEGEGSEEQGQHGSDGDRKAQGTIRTRITFTDAEIREFRTLNLDPQIKILGFQDPKGLRFEDNVKHSTFIYPDENSFSGSTRTFAALLAACANRNRVAVALALLRRNAIPMFCCLIPQPETYDQSGSQDKPPGFHLIPLPFADDIRERPEKISPLFEKCTESQKNKMIEIMNKLRMKNKIYDPQVYPNPALQFFYAKLQALAFEEDFFDPMKTEDKTKPLVEGMHQIAGTYMKQFNDLLMLDERIGRTVNRGTKRDEPDHVVSNDYVEGFFKQGCEAKLLVKDLKAYIEQNSLPIDLKARKDVLIEMLRPFIRKAGGDTKPNKRVKRET